MKTHLLIAGAMTLAPGGVGLAREQPAAPTAPAAAPAAAPASPDAARLHAAQEIVRADWARYDKDGTGYLTPLEFGTWVMAAAGQNMTAQVERTARGKAARLPAIKVLNATSAAFFKADTNHDNRISREELTAFLAQ